MTTRTLIRRGILSIIVVAILFIAATIFKNIAAGGDDLFYGKFFPPDFVIAKSAEIGLTAEQQRRILDILKDENNLRMILLDRANQERELRDALNATPFDPKNVEQHLSKMLEYEYAAKKTHVLMFLHVRSLLTPEQAEKLRALMGIKQQ